MLKFFLVNNIRSKSDKFKYFQLCSRYRLIKCLMRQHAAKRGQSPSSLYYAVASRVTYGRNSLPDEFRQT